MHRDDRAPREDATAVLIRKEEIPYTDLATGKGIPIQKPIYDLIFRIANGEEITFSVSELEYGAVDVQDQGQLVFIKHKHYNELISFADKIHDFKMD